MQHDTNHLGQPIGFPLPHWKPPEPPAREVMEGRFCRIEPLDPNLHAASLHAANAQDTEGSMWTYLPYGPFDSPGGYRAWLVEMCAGSDPLFYAMIDKARQGNRQGNRGGELSANRSAERLNRSGTHRLLAIVATHAGGD